MEWARGIQEVKETVALLLILRVVKKSGCGRY